MSTDKSGVNAARVTPKTGKPENKAIKILQHKDLNNLVKHDNRNIKRRIKLMTGCKSFRSAQAILAGTERVYMIYKG